MNNQLLKTDTLKQKLLKRNVFKTGFANATLSLGLTLALMGATFTSAAVAADWPKRPINLIVPYKAGGGTDAYARAVAAVAKDVLGVPVAVVNRPGSGGLNGATTLLSAKNDGYTMMLTSGGSFLLSTMLRKTPVNALDSFEFVAQVGLLQTSLMVPINSPFKTVSDVIESAKKPNSTLRWAHSGRGGFHFVAGLGFLNKNSLQIQDVPYKGGGPTRAALIGGQADFGFLGVQQLAGFEKQLRALAVNSDKRDIVMKDVPSFAEQGIPFAAISSPVIVLAPKGTAPEIIAKMEKALADIAQKPKFAALLSKRGTGAVFKSGAQSKAALSAMKIAAEPLLNDLKK